MALRVVLCSILLVFAWVSPSLAQAAMKLRIEIPEQTLSSALAELARQAHIQVVYSTELVAGRTSRAVDGSMTPTEALTRLLSNTGLRFEFIDAQTVTLAPEGGSGVPARAPSAAPAPSAPRPRSDNRPTPGRFLDRTRFRFAAIDRTNASGGEPSESLEAGTTSSPQEVVVTATKRSLRLQEVPFAISALSGETLAMQGAVDFVDYARSIPGLSFTDNGTGRQKAAIRGVNPTTGSSTVAFYIGETPMPASAGNFGGTLQNPKLIDIARIEVLRGPQGTLYGAGSVGGTIKVIPQPPDLSALTGYVEAGASKFSGSGSGYDVTGVINVPLVKDTLGLRVAAWNRTGDGFITVRFPGGSHDDMPHQSTHGVRATARFQPFESLDISAMVYHESERSNGFQDITAGATNPNDALEQIFLSDIPEPHENRFTLGSLTVKWSLRPITITSVTSYSDARRQVIEEGTAAVQALFHGDPLPNSLTEENSNGDFTQEIRLATSHSFAGFDAIVGLYYDRQHLTRTMFWDVPGFSAQYAPNGPSDPLYAQDDIMYTRNGPSYYREKSAFGELTYTLGRLKLTGGMRHYHIENGKDEVISGFFNGGTSPNTPRGEFSGSVHKASLSYTLTPDHLLFAQYAEGFRPGFGLFGLPDRCDADLAEIGVSGEAPQVDPDSVKSYEIGLKSSWLGRRLVVNASVFRMDWEDVQTNIQLGCGFDITANSTGGVRSRGFELEGSLLVLPNLTVGLSASTTRSTFNSDELTLGAHAGDQLQNVPEWQFAVYSQYDFRLSNGWNAFARLDLQDTAASYVAFDRLDDGITRDPLTYRGETRLLNARLGVNAGRWRVALYGENLFDDVERQARQISSIVNTPGRPRYVVNRPRTIGLEARFQF